MVKTLKIKDFPDYYITDTGDVYSRNPVHNPNGRIKKMNPWVNKYGYKMVDLIKDGKKIHKQVHRLVAQEFIPNPENKPQVNHIDGNKQNNTVSNLEWATASENIAHTYRVLKYKPQWLGKFGKNHNCSKQILQIKDGNIIAEFDGMLDAERQLHINSTSICECCKGKRHTAGGFQWKYKV